MTKRFALVGLVAALGGLLTGSVSTPIGAQTAPTPAPGGRHRGMGGGRMLQNIMAQLNLTADQKTKVRPIVDNATNQLQAMRGDTSIAPQDRRTKARQIVTAAMAQINPILTADQQKQLQTMRAQAASRRGRGAGGGQMAMMDQQLGLSADQKTKIESIIETTRSHVRQIHGDATLTAQQQQTKIQAIHKSSTKQIMAILTPAQQEQLAALRHGPRIGTGTPPAP